VTDVVMPGLSGTDLAATVLERYPAIGVVLLSGYTAETLDLADVLGRGAQFVGKPFTQSQLTDALRASIPAGVDPR
jgi:FixJ family two-component response regulator